MKSGEGHKSLNMITCNLNNCQAKIKMSIAVSFLNIFSSHLFFVQN